MTDWREARNSSPWLEAYRPGAGGWQGPAMKAWWMGSGTRLVMCVWGYVCMSVWVALKAPFSLIRVTGGTQGKVMIGHTVRKNEQTNFRSSHTEKFILRSSDTFKKVCMGTATHPSYKMRCLTTATWLHAKFSWVFILKKQKKTMSYYWHQDNTAHFNSETS